MRRLGFVFYILFMFTVAIHSLQAQDKITFNDCIWKALEAN